jgi:hypothetical protein
LSSELCVFVVGVSDRVDVTKGSRQPHAGVESGSRISHLRLLRGAKRDNRSGTLVIVSPGDVNFLPCKQRLVHASLVDPLLAVFVCEGYTTVVK